MPGEASPSWQCMYLCTLKGFAHHVHICNVVWVHCCRVLAQVEASDPTARDDRRVDELLRILGPAHIRDLALVFELMTYEELATSCPPPFS